MDKRHQICPFIWINLKTYNTKYMTKCFWYFGHRAIKGSFPRDGKQVRWDAAASAHFTWRGCWGWGKWQGTQVELGRFPAVRTELRIWLDKASGVHRVGTRKGSCAQRRSPGDLNSSPRSFAEWWPAHANGELWEPWKDWSERIRRNKHRGTQRAGNGSCSYQQ